MAGGHAWWRCMAGGYVWWGACMAGGVHGRVGPCVAEEGACMAEGGKHGRGACMAAGMCMAGVCMAEGGMHGRGGHVWQGACMAGGGHSWQEMCMAGGHAWHICPPPRYYEIRSMSGRYASYWNAYLFYIVSFVSFSHRCIVYITSKTVKHAKCKIFYKQS